jgi:hypothetical protein
MLNSQSTDTIFNFEMTGDIRRGALFSERTIRIKNYRLLYNKKNSKTDKKLFTITKFDISQNMNPDTNDYRFEFFNRKCKFFDILFYNRTR